MSSEPPSGKWGSLQDRPEGPALDEALGTVIHREGQEETLLPTHEAGSPELCPCRPVRGRGRGRGGRRKTLQTVAEPRAS